MHVEHSAKQPPQAPFGYHDCPVVQVRDRSAPVQIVEETVNKSGGVVTYMEAIFHANFAKRAK